MSERNIFFGVIYSRLTARFDDFTECLVQICFLSPAFSSTVRLNGNWAVKVLAAVLFISILAARCSICEPVKESRDSKPTGLTKLLCLSCYNCIPGLAIWLISNTYKRILKVLFGKVGV